MTWFPGLEKLSVYVSSVPIHQLYSGWGYTAEVMEFEFQVCGKLFFVAEDDPSETSIDKTILMSRTRSQRALRWGAVRIDTFDTWNLESEFH